MPTILSDADVFGTSPKAPTPRIPQSAGSVLNDAEVFGDASPPMPTPRQRTRAPRSDASIALGGVGAGTKAVARSVADFTDMLLSVPGMAMGSAADVASRVQSLLEGNTPAEAGRIAQTVRRGITSDFSPTVMRSLTEAAIQAVAPDKDRLEPSDVQRGMEVITQGLEKGGKWVEKKTNGFITAETFDSLVNEGMALGGVRGVQAGTKAIIDRRLAKQNAADAKAALEERPQPTQPEADFVVTPSGTIIPKRPQAQDSTVRRAAEEAAGVREPLSNKALQARQKQFADAIKDDPAYADRLATMAEGEAALREGAPPPLSAPGGLPQTGPRTPRTGLRTAVEPPETPRGAAGPIDTGVVPSLDSALAKIREGRTWDLTSEERIVMRDARSQFGVPDIVDAQGNKIPRSQRGASSTELNQLIAAFGLTTGLAVYAYYNQDRIPETLGMAAGMIGARSAIGPLLKEGGYTLKTLERLPQNRTEFSRQQVMDQLNRPDVSKAERDLVEKVLGDKETVTATELIDGFRKEAKDLELKPKATSEYAEYGLENIGRDRVSYNGGSLTTGVAAQNVPARTTIYRNERMNDTNNHFDDPQYFAHARSFDENGVRHVVELQSDVAQHAKVLAPEERARTQESYDLLNRMAKAAEDVQEAVNSAKSTIPDYLKAINGYEATWKPDVALDIKMRLGARIANKIDWREGGPFDSVVERAARNGEYEVVYDASKKLLETADRQTRGRLHNDMTYVRQVAAAMEDAYFNETKLLDLRASEAQAKLGSDVSGIQPLLKNWYKRIVREEQAQVPGQPVRFATADTVAKVEGWPRTFSGKMQPEHQSIYDRYKSDIEKFLRNDLGGKEYTDPNGHTWIEVPGKPHGPTQMFGRAGTREMATLAAASGAALAVDAMQGDDSSIGLDAAAGLIAGAIALKGSPRLATAAIGGAALAAFLSSEEKRAGNATLTAAVLGIAAFARSKNKTIARWAHDTGEASEIVLGNLSAELRKMSPPLLRRFTAFERNLKIREHDALTRISPLAEGLLDLPKATREAIDVALFNGDRARALKIAESLPKSGLAKGMREAFKYVDETGAKLDSMGLVRKLNRDHFPRIVSDLDGLMERLGKEGGDLLGRKLIEAQSDNLRRTGAPLSDLEMSKVVNQHLLAAINQSDLGGQAGILKKRTISEVAPALLPFYATAADSIALYARAASREIERANFFGRDLVKNAETKGVNVPGSIGQLIANERAAKRLDHAQLARLESILKARFGPGERSPNWLTQSYKNIVYSMLLGNPFSALVQFGDAAVAVAVHGVLPSMKALVQSVTGKSKWHLSDEGLVNHISEDLIIGARDPLRIGNYEINSAKFLDKMLKYSGFSFVDEFSKMIHLNASAAKFERLAQNAKGVKEIERLYGDYFGKDLPQLVRDLNQRKKTPLVGELIFRELSDTQPITKLEMPQGYLASPNARVLYTLKTFMVKQLNLVRERGVREIAKGDPASIARGVGFLLRYSTALGLSGAAISYLQDWILGREPSFTAADVAENVFKSFGWGAYAVNEARKGRALQSAASLIAPPYKMFEEIWATPEQLEKFADEDPKANPKGAMYIPLVGKLIYNRMLGGAERANRRKELEDRRNEMKGGY